jgi:hypothetical protein
MIAGINHLLFWNLAIALFESVVLVFFFRRPFGKSLLALIVANYLSAGLGGSFISPAIAAWWSFDVRNLWLLFGLMLFITYLITVTLEAPFVAFLFRRDPAWKRKTVLASLVIQSLSYIFLCGYFWTKSNTSLLTQTQVVERTALALPEKVQVYFISETDGDLYTGTLARGQWRRVFDLDSRNRNDDVFVWRASGEAAQWQLVIRKWDDTSNHSNLVFIPGFSPREVAPLPGINGVPEEKLQHVVSGCCAAPKLGGAQSSSWNFRAGRWPGEGLLGAPNDASYKVKYCSPWRQFSLGGTFAS